MGQARRKAGVKSSARTVADRAKRRGVKMHSPAVGPEAAKLPPLPMPFREALGDYFKVDADAVKESMAREKTARKKR